MVLLRKKSVSACASAARPATAHSATSAMSWTTASMIASSLGAVGPRLRCRTRSWRSRYRSASVRGREDAPSAFRHPIADARLGQHDLRVIGLVLDLLPQLADIDPQILRVLDMRRAPDRGEDLLVRQHPASVAGEERQQIELLRG